MLRFLFEGNTKKEQTDTKSFYDRMHSAYEQSGLCTDDAITDTQSVFEVLVEEFPIDLNTTPFTQSLYVVLETLATQSDLYEVLEGASDEIIKDMEIDSLNRQRMQRKITLYAYADENRKRVKTVLYHIGYALCAALPDTFLSTPTSNQQSYQVAVMDVFQEPARLIQDCVQIFFSHDLHNTVLFYVLKTALEQNLERVSASIKKEALPEDLKNTHRARDIAHLFLQNTPLENIFSQTVPFRIPEQVVYEHTLLCAGTGHGKTQTLQYMMCESIDRAKEGQGGFCVIDSQGDLIRNISHLADMKHLGDKLLILDANDIMHPLALNLFDVGLDRFNEIDAVDREKILNSALDLYEYIFSKLLGAELTQKQGVIFTYLARMMLVIPHATIRTLGDFVLHGEKYKHHFQELDPSTRHFFETQFFGNSFKPTRTQVYTRLLGVLSNPVMERMFSARENKIDMFEAMNSGKVILINTAKDLLKSERSAIFGRFMIALIAQAAMSRTVIPEQKRLRFDLYIDEASEYFDEKIEDIANQARKMKVAMVLAFQNLAQTSGPLRATLMSSTSTKMVGGVSATDAEEFGKNMRCKAEDILKVKKTRKHTQFLCFVKNVTHAPLVLTIPLGQLEKRKSLSDAEYKTLIAENRQRVSMTLEEAEQSVYDASYADTPSEPKASERNTQPSSKHPTPPQPAIDDTEVIVPTQIHTPPADDLPQSGKGGKKHKRIQHELKQCAEALGFKADIEHPVSDGGFIDVVISKNGFKVACEISVTTSSRHECKNIEKCLNAGYETIFVIKSHAQSIKALTTYIHEHIAEEHHAKIQCFSMQDFREHLSSMAEPTKKNTSHGYQVRTEFLETTEEVKRQKEAMIERVVGRRDKR